MLIVNTDTNAIVGTFRVPVGTFEFPLEGNIGVFTTGWTTNYSISSGDTLVMWTGGADLLPGVAVWEWYVAGLGVSFMLLGIMMIRKGMRLLVHGPERVDL